MFFMFKISLKNRKSHLVFNRKKLLKYLWSLCCQIIFCKQKHVYSPILFYYHLVFSSFSASYNLRKINDFKKFNNFNLTFMKFKPPCTALKLGPNSLFFQRDPLHFPPQMWPLYNLHSKLRAKRHVILKWSFLNQISKIHK